MINLKSLSIIASIIFIFLLTGISYAFEVKIMLAPMLKDVGEESKVISMEDYGFAGDIKYSEILKNAKRITDMSKEGWRIVYVEPIKYPTGIIKHMIIFEK